MKIKSSFAALEGLKKIAARSVVSGSYTVLGEIDITGSAAPKLINAAYRTYQVEIPIWDEAGTTIVERIKVNAQMPEMPIMEGAQLRMSQCKVDKAYNVNGNKGTTYAGKVRFELVPQLTLPMTIEVFTPALELFNGFIAKEQAAVTA